MTTTTPATLAQSTEQLRRRALHALRTCGVDTTTLPGTGREGRWAGQDKTECGLHGE